MVDYTPTWRTTARLCIELLDTSSHDVAARNHAKHQLTRMGEIIDALIKEKRDKKK